MRLKTAIAAADILRLCEIDPSNQEGSKDLFISRIDAPEWSTAGSLTFLGQQTPLRVLHTLRTSLIIAEPGVAEITGIPKFEVASIHQAMSTILLGLKEHFFYSSPFPGPEKKPGNLMSNSIMSNAIVEGELEGNVYVGPGAFIAKGSYIGAGTRIEANATILENCSIGRNCIIQSGAVIGSAGFGFFAGPDGLQPMVHLAGVEIADNCWIGANSVIAAGVLNPTSLGAECKLDSHVQIAHNVRLGSNALLASQSGIAGSTSIGKRFQMGGAASIDGHLKIGDDVSVAACSGVTKDLADKSVVAGFPARPIGEWRRQQIGIKQIIARDQGRLPRHG